jgi:hypothetical protein
MMKLSDRARILATVLVVYVVCDILLTPLGGLETRPSANVTTVGFATVSLLFVGLALSIASLVLLFYKPRRAPILAILAAILYFPAFLADQAGYFSTLRPPGAIASLEILQALVAIAAIVVSLSMRAEKSATNSKP